MRRWIAAMAAATVMLLCSGCSFVNLDTEKQLRAPHAQGEQSEIQTALEQHIYSRNAQPEAESEVISYVLKYPRMGDYRSAFILDDLDSDGTKEAIAFYALQPEGVNSRIALLRKTDGQWRCVDDIEGLATEIERIDFADLDGNGTKEIAAGFSMYNTRDRRLVLYSLEQDRFKECYSDTYTHMLVGHMSDEAVDDLLLFRLNTTDKKTTARLLSMDNGEVLQRGATELDGGITQFEQYAFATFDDGVRGVFQDCKKDSMTTITELIVWDGKSLSAPLFDTELRITTLSARESSFSFKDINGDGRYDWPTSKRLVGDERKPADDVQLWLSEWYSWSPLAGVEKVHTAVVNPYDGYQVTVPDELLGTVTAQYDEILRLLTVKQVKAGKIGEELFAIVAYPIGEKNPAGDDFELLMTLDSHFLALRFREGVDETVTKTMIHSLISLYEIEA